MVGTPGLSPEPVNIAGGIAAGSAPRARVGGCGWQDRGMTVDTAVAGGGSAHPAGLRAERVGARRRPGQHSRDAAAGVVPVAAGAVVTPEWWAQR